MKGVGICFHPQDKIYYFNQKDFTLKIGDIVIVETDLGIEAGKVCSIDEEINKTEFETSAKSILRKATSTDLEKIEKYKQKKEGALKFCRKAINKHKLSMKLVDVHFSFDGSRMIFYFTAEKRIDFRDLVKDLTRHFQKSIRLQQVGSRDVAAKFSGCGVCGRELCCARFLKEFKSITLDIAKLQQIDHRGSERISGLCGRLMCCLAFEAELYKNLAQAMPKLGTEVQTPDGVGKVTSRDILNQKIEVDLGEETKRIFEISEIKWKTKA